MANAVQLKIQDNKIAVVTLDQPDSKVNLLSSKVMLELNAVIDQLDRMPDIKGLIIASAKKDTFIAGADVGEIQNIQSQPAVKIYEASVLGKQVFQKLADLSVPVVAAINGLCLGGGTELALACHIRVMSTKAKIGLPECKLGVIPGWGGCVRLPLLVGLQNAIQLVTASKIVDARKAWKLGLCDEYAELDQLMILAQEILLRRKPKRHKDSFATITQKILLESNPMGRSILEKMARKAILKETRGNYPAHLEALKVILIAKSAPKAKAYEAESRAFTKLAATQTSRNLVGIFFAQQESKKFFPDASSACDLKTIGVLGAGVMGAGIAQVSAYAGHKVVLYDIKPEPLAHGMANIKKLFDNLVVKHRMTRSEADARLSNITATTDFSSFATCSFIEEAAPERIEIKKSLISEIEKVTNGNPLMFASNTSSLSINQLAQSAHNPANVIGVHFFNPVHKMPLVEIIKGKQTSDAAIACAKQFAASLGKTTVVVNDSAGFVVNRILVPYLLEAARMAEQGVPILDIDKAAIKFGMPMGPFALMDEVGLDIGAEVIQVVHNAFGDRMAAPKLMTVIKDLKLVGKKGGRGFYVYDDKSHKKLLNPDIVSAINMAPQFMAVDVIQDRLFMVMINEAARCIEEGVIDSASQLDLAMIFGTGFPPFRGGVLRYADQLGIKLVLQKLELLSRVASENYKPAKLLVDLAASGRTFYPA